MACHGPCRTPSSIQSTIQYRPDRNHPSNPEESKVPPPLLPKLFISGAALAALLHRYATAVGDCDGLLFGRASHLPTPPTTLSDHDDVDAAPPAPVLTISVSGHCSLSHPSSLSDPHACFQPPSLDPSSTLDIFSTHRRIALRPSMREFALVHSLSKALQQGHPFLLISPSASPNLSTHTYDYCAFLLLDARLVPAPLTVINVGPRFRDQYHAFFPQSPMPYLSIPQPSSPAAAAPQDHHPHTIGE
ncbi:hypothetical protein HU200_039110 [Digitaria exilis]|uniref:Uncharacterized protein n=1 Tax=Digitaria exilis TaxID=1010633 RepID=A0A835EK92_9POAL|nr:hypothetical protein HU200_039110 [Digitaria exilis]